MKTMLNFYDALTRAERVARYRAQAFKGFVIIVAAGIIFWQLVLLSSDAFGETVVVYHPVVITWYGKHVEKKTQAQPGIRSRGDCIGSTNKDCVDSARKDCDTKVEELRKSLKTNDTKFASVVVCVERTVEITEPEEEEKGK